MDQPFHGTATPDEPHEERALSALRRLARPQPRAFDAPGPAMQEPSLGSATGFVSTLAKGLPEDSRMGDAQADDSRAGEPHLDDSGVGAPGLSDSSLAGAAAASAPRKPAGELIQMAREITIQRPASPLAARSRGRFSGPPARGRGLSAMMIALALVLLAIGGWAIGALVYMHQVTPMSPREIRYPLLTWNTDPSLDLHTASAYGRASVLMAWGMLVCVPVGVVLLAGAMLGRRRAMRPK